MSAARAVRVFVGFARELEADINAFLSEREGEGEAWAVLPPTNARDLLIVVCARVEVTNEVLR